MCLTQSSNSTRYMPKKDPEREENKNRETWDLNLGLWETEGQMHQSKRLRHKKETKSQETRGTGTRKMSKLSHGTVILTFRWTLTSFYCSCASKCPFICWPSAVLYQQDPGPMLEAMGGWCGQGVKLHCSGLAFGSVGAR